MWLGDGCCHGGQTEKEEQDILCGSDEGQICDLEEYGVKLFAKDCPTIVFICPVDWSEQDFEKIRS